MALPGAFEILGVVASILQLAGFVRYLFDKAYDVSGSWVKRSGWDRFVKYLNAVENVVKPYMINSVWLENPAMIRIMKDLKVELERAWHLVHRLFDANRVWRAVKASSFAKKLEQSRANIQSYVSLIQMAAESKQPVLTSTAQVGHARSGNEDLVHAIALSPYVEEHLTANRNEDLDHAIALSLCVEEHLTANRIGSSYQVHADDEFARALQESLRIGSTSHSHRSRRFNPQNRRSSYQVHSDEDLARALQESLVIGSTSRTNQHPVVNRQNTRSSYQVHADDEFARALQESLRIGSTSHSHRSRRFNPQNRRSSYQVHSDEDLARALQESLVIGSTSRTNQPPVVNRQNTRRSSQVEDDEELA